MTDPAPPDLDAWTRERIDAKAERVRELDAARERVAASAPTIADLVERFPPWPEDAPEISGRVERRNGAG